MEKGGNAPIRSLLNTFVSATRRDRHYRQAAARSCRRCSEPLGEKRLGRQKVLLLLLVKKKNKDEGVFP